MSVDPSYSTTDEVAAEIAADLERPVLLLTDFDGTLCEFQADPAAVFLSERRRAALSALAARADMSVGVVSGRRAADVRRRTALDGPVYYAGLHGMEINGPDTGFEVPDLALRRDLLQGIAGAVAEAIAPLPGAFIENKDLSVALHVRAAAPADRERASARSGRWRRRRSTRDGTAAARRVRLRAAPRHHVEQGGRRPLDRG